MKEYMEFFMSDDAVGDDGYLLICKGLIPLPASARAKFQNDASTLANLVR